MIVRTLELKNFRNYEDLTMELSPERIFFSGDNAQGKTNILEAIYLCATTKSHRGTKDKDIINFDSDESHIRMQVVKDHVVNRIDMHLRRNKSKGVAINSIPIKKSSELFGHVNVVFFHRKIWESLKMDRPTGAGLLTWNFASSTVCIIIIFIITTRLWNKGIISSVRLLLMVLRMTAWTYGTSAGGLWQ